MPFLLLLEFVPFSRGGNVIVHDADGVWEQSVLHKSHACVGVIVPDRGDNKKEIALARMDVSFSWFPLVFIIAQWNIWVSWSI